MEKGGLIVGKGHVLGVAVHTVDAERIQLSYVYLQRKRDGVHVRAQGIAGSPQELAAAVGPRVPVALALDTDRCVHRVLERSGTPEELLRQAFPNAPLDELVTSLWTTGSSTGASMARRSAALDVIERLRNAGFRVVRSSVGPWGLLHLRALLDEHQAEWRLGGYAFTMDGDAVRRIVREDQALRPLDLDGERVEAEHALAFAAAWEHLSPAAERLDAPMDELRQDQQQERARQRYEAGIVAVLLALVVVVGGERIIAAHLQHVQASLQVSVSAHTKDMEDVAALRQRVAELERLDGPLADGKERLSLQAARIAASVPTGIRLERLMERPLRTPLKEKLPMEVAAGIVDVHGACADAHVLDGWMTALKQLPGITSVKLLAYAVDAEDGRPRFQLELGP